MIAWSRAIGAAALAAILGASVPDLAAAQAAPLCTGSGLDEREEAKSVKHTMKLVFAARNGDYLGDVAVTVTRGGEQVFALRCDAPWVLADLPAGSYQVSATFGEATKTATVTVPGRGAVEKTFVY